MAAARASLILTMAIRPISQRSGQFISNPGSLPISSKPISASVGPDACEGRGPVGGVRRPSTAMT
jgi:hypothetical protein